MDKLFKDQTFQPPAKPTTTRKTPKRSFDEQMLQNEQLDPALEDSDGNADSKPMPSSCCPQNENLTNTSTRKYLLSFESTLVPGLTANEDDDECTTLSKQKCKAFWSFVDSDPKLTGLIKDGEFVQSTKSENTGNAKSTKLKKSGKNVFKMPTDKELRRMSSELAEESRHRKAEAKERLEKRRAFNNELIQKSGQPTTIKKPAEFTMCTSNPVKLAASEIELIGPLLKEMNVYDKIYVTKITNFTNKVNLKPSHLI